MKLIHSIVHETGLNRTNNEDAVRWKTPKESWIRQSMGTLAIVSDGMGGYARGEKASAMVVDTVSKTYYDHNQSPTEALREAGIQANNAVAIEGIESSTKMGATCTALAILPHYLHIMHVGDSRCYVAQNGGLNQVTKDHTVAREMSESLTFPSSNQTTMINPHALTKAMGIKLMDQFEGDIISIPNTLRKKDRILLCSDGLYLHIKNDELNTVLNSSKSLKETTDLLVKKTLQRGARDNFSFILIERQ